MANNSYVEDRLASYGAILTLADCARILGVSFDVVCSLARTGQLPTFLHDEEGQLVLREELVAYIRARIE